MEDFREIDAGCSKKNSSKFILIIFVNPVFLGARGDEVIGHSATNRKVSESIPDSVTRIFH
jgi:hypothetical protein